MKNNLEIYRKCPHVVILGAGASVAAIPNGDKFGRKISVMDGFIDNLGMRDLLKGIKFKSGNLEDIYSELSEHPEYDDLRQELPDAKGFSPTNLKYFKYFYELYHQEIANRQQPVDGSGADELFSIPWGHHVQIINRCDGGAK